jgi:uncharacterized protein YbjQ (UPF0145 family)
MIVTTTPEVQGRPVQEYFGVSRGRAILGANVSVTFRRHPRHHRRRSGSYERVLREARDMAIAEMQEEASGAAADAVVGVDLTTRRSATRAPC